MRRAVGITGGAALAGVGGVALVFLHMSRLPVDPLAGMKSWSPNPVAVRLAVGNLAKPESDAARHREFARLFKQRFRDHGVGISLAYDHSDRMELACVAPMPRADMARIAVLLYHESKEVFSSTPVVDILATTGLGNVKIGEAREIPGSATVDVRFFH